MVRVFGKVLGRVLFALFLLIGAAYLFAPKERVDAEIAFRENDLPRGIDAFLAGTESQFSDIVPGTEKRVIWAGEAGRRTGIAVVYLHGFSATSEEIRPVPDLVAKALGANLYFVRYAGHGRSAAAMAEPRAGDWLEDTAEALGIGRALGDQVIVIATSTGGTLAAIAATDASLIDAVAGIVFVSPNFRVGIPGAPILTMPFARWWGPMLVGEEIGFDPVNEANARYWTERYPSEAAFPLGALVSYARGLDYTGVTTPALFVYSEQDTVVSPSATERVAQLWAAEVEVKVMEPLPGDDAMSHILAGDILSPGGTAPLVTAILDWAGRL